MERDKLNAQVRSRSGNRCECTSGDHYHYGTCGRPLMLGGDPVVKVGPGETVDDYEARCPHCR